MDDFVNLHVHTSIGSMLDSMIRVNELFDLCKLRGQSAVAITDHGTCTAFYDVHKEYSRTKVKGIPGIEMYFVNNLNDEKEKSKHIVLLAQNEKGCRNIMRMNYEGFKFAKTVIGKTYPRIGWEHLEKFNEGIICLSACSNGILAKHIMEDNVESAMRDALRLQNIFEHRFYLEVQPHSVKSDRADQTKINQSLYGLYKKTGISMVATNDVHYLLKEDHKYHDMLLAIGDRVALANSDRRTYANEFYLKGAKDVVSYFGEELGSQLCKTTVEIAEQCEPPDYLENTGYKLPEFPVNQEKCYKEFLEWKKEFAPDIKEDVAYLRYKCIQNFPKFNFKDEDKYWNRTKNEVSVIEEKGLGSYMLIVSDYIENARKKGCDVGPARGSSAGSLVAMLLGITTDVDPIEYDLMFERFINPKREQLADIDTDFGDPQIVKDYLIEKYGREYVASIANIIYMRPKVVIKDIARSLRIGSEGDTFKIANQITSTIPDDVKTVEEAREISKEFDKYMTEYPEIYQYAIRLQNLPRQHGIHAAGVVISDRPLPDNIPLKIDKHGVVATQYEKDRVENCGFLKVDLLGLETLNVIRHVKNIIKSRGKVVPEKIPLNDKKTYELISSGNTLGVFQLEASLAPLCKMLAPKNILDVSDINALGRPGCPPEERKEFVARKLGRVKSYPLHPKLKGVLSKTQDKCVYEEDLLALGKNICGWDLGRADIMRRICKGKQKTAHLLPKLKEEFVSDAYKNGVKKEDAEKLFEIVKYFSSYGFNKSHSVAYSTISYYTAYYKAHYPTEYLTALINSEDPNSGKVQVYQNEMRENGIEILPPDLDKSDEKYTIEGNKKVRMGLSSLKGVGAVAINSIVANRPYKTLLDFIEKVDHRVVNIRVVSNLICAGCFDRFGINRRTLSENYINYKMKYQSEIKKEKEKLHKGACEKQYIKFTKENPLSEMTKKEFILSVPKSEMSVNVKNFNYEFPKMEEWDVSEKLEREREILGDYISGSIDDVYGNFFIRDPKAISLESLEGIPDGAVVRFEGVIRKRLKLMKVKREASRQFGKEFAKYLIEDLKKSLGEMTVFPKVYKEYGGILKDNTPIICTCEVGSFNGKKDLQLRTVVKI